MAVVPSGPGAEVDAVAAVLRALANHAVRPGATSDLEAWARHLLVLSPAPGRHAWQPVRDWNGMRQYVVGHIRDERTGAAQAIDDLQGVLWALIDGMSRAVVQDATEDREAAACLDRLREAASSSTEELKRAAIEIADELAGLIEAKTSRSREMARTLGERVDVMREELNQARRQAELDGLTQLGNRGQLDRELARALQLHVLTGEPYALLMADLDGFKAINDRFGHPVGDEALRAVADGLALCFPRRSDVVCRYGGDEFAVVLRDVDTVDAERLGGRLVETVLGLEPDGIAALSLTVSVGVAIALATDTPSSWVARADQALYEAKSTGRNRVCFEPVADSVAGEQAA